MQIKHKKYSVSVFLIQYYIVQIEFTAIKQSFLTVYQTLFLMRKYYIFTYVNWVLADGIRLYSYCALQGLPTFYELK